MVDWKKLWDRNNKGLLIDRIDGKFSYTKNGYRFNRYLMRAGIALIMIFIGFVFIIGMTRGIGLHEFYYGCPVEEITGCPNDFRLQCDQELLSKAGAPSNMCGSLLFRDRLVPGESYGTPPNKSFVRVATIVDVSAFIVFFLLILVNHLLYNRGKSAMGDE